MNTVASEARLFRHLALTPYLWFQAFFCLFAAHMSMTVDHWGRWGFPLFLFIYLVNLRIEWENYRAVGMTRSHWRRHRRILVSGIVALVLIETLLIAVFSGLPLNPVLIGAVLAAWAWTLMRRSEPARSLAELAEQGGAEENEGKEDGHSRFPLTPVQQIIRGPQVSTWIVVWGMVAFLVLVLAVLAWIFGAAPQWVLVVLAVVGMQALWLFMGSVGKSLREWVAFGGSRVVWARETALLGLLSPLLAGLITVVAGAVFAADAVLEVLPMALGFGFFVPVIFTLGELSDRKRTWWVTLPYLAAGAGILTLGITDHIGAWGFLAGFVAVYLVHSVTLPAVTERFTVFSGGVSAWMGLRAEAKV